MKKVALLTHPYHKKTKSANILAEEIFDKKDFLVDYYYIQFTESSSLIFDEVIEGYDIVILMQLISPEILSKISCDNIVFIPMYDMSVSWNVYKWLECANLKILSFTKKMHGVLSQLGLNSYYIKYYPEPDEFMPGDPKNIFLWQRINSINIHTTLKLLSNHTIKQIHLHKAIDPYHTFKEPSKEEIERYNIVFSGWFKDRNKYLEIIKNTGVYMAPRTMEGGASAFIDAMKKGKIVIAHNDAAMNEYIIHNETGFLYDINNIEPIHFDSIDLIKMQKNAYQSIREGRDAWRKSIPDILNFIATDNSIYIPDAIVKAVQEQSFEQNYNVLLQEKVRLEEQLTSTVQAFNQLQEDPWYQFGKLSKKDKFLNFFKKGMEALKQ